MHPKIIYPGPLAPILEDLSRPVFDDLPLNPSRHVDTSRETSLLRGCSLDLSAFEHEKHLATLQQDWQHFMKVMHVPEHAGHRIVACRAEVPGVAQDAHEAHHIDITPDHTTITAADVRGLRRALYHLQDHMLIARCPVLPLGQETRCTTMAARIVRSPIATYRWHSGWELEDDNDYYPDAYLQRLSRSGINGLWIAGLLRKMVPSAVIPELNTPDYRLDKLNQIIEKAAKYGIDIYFFCMEPRAIQLDHPVAKSHPDIVGPRGQMCSSNPKVLAYTREVFHNLFKHAPGLAGAINIFCGERPTTCVSLLPHAHLCPKCNEHPRHELLAGTLNACMAGMRSANPQAKLLAWTYIMASSREASPIDPMLEVMDQTDPEVIWLGNFDHGTPKSVWGKEVIVHEYTLSAVGPAPDFTALAKATRHREKEVYAKLQIGTSYELSSVPYLPQPGVAHDKIRAAQSVGCTGAMLTWIPGGFPSPHHTLAGMACFNDADHETNLLRTAAISWGETNAQKITQAWKHLDRTWRDGYPFDNAVLYYSPITRAAAYQLHLEKEPEIAKPYNFGLTRKRVAQPHEDQVDRWVGHLDAPTIIDAFRRLGHAWQEGVATLQQVLDQGPFPLECHQQVAIAKAVGLQCLCTANVYEFYTLRDQLLAANPKQQQAILTRLCDIARDEIAHASAMLEAMAADPRIGFESEIFDYSFSPSLVREKILQVQDTLVILQRWKTTGVDPQVLQRTTQEAEALRPDRDPERWGD